MTRRDAIKWRVEIDRLEELRADLVRQLGREDIHINTGFGVQVFASTRRYLLISWIAEVDKALRTAQNYEGLAMRDVKEADGEIR